MRKWIGIPTKKTKGNLKFLIFSLEKTHNKKFSVCMVEVNSKKCNPNEKLNNNHCLQTFTITKTRNKTNFKAFIVSIIQSYINL